MVHAITLRIPVRPHTDLAYVTDALGECVRSLECEEAQHPLGLVPDPDDPGRYAWAIVAESYPAIGE